MSITSLFKKSSNFFSFSIKLVCLIVYLETLIHICFKIYAPNQQCVMDVRAFNRFKVHLYRLCVHSVCDVSQYIAAAASPVNTLNESNWCVTFELNAIFYNLISSCFHELCNSLRKECYKNMYTITKSNSRVKKNQSGSKVSQSKISATII